MVAMKLEFMQSIKHLNLSLKTTPLNTILAVLIILIAFTLNVWDIDGRSIWFDEGMEYWVATSSIAQMAENVQIGIQDPPLYSLILHGWMKFGKNAFSLRFLSVAFSLIALVGVMRISHKLAGQQAGLIAGAIMAVLPVNIRYAQEVGQYALMGCLLVLSLLVLQKLSSNTAKKTTDWHLYLLWTSLALAATYSYYGTVFTLLIPFWVLIIKNVLKKAWLNVGKQSLALLLYGLGITPLLIFFLPHQLFRGNTANAFQITLSQLVAQLKTLPTTTQHLIAFQTTSWPWTTISVWFSSSLILVPIIVCLLQFKKLSSQAKLWVIWSILTWGGYYFSSLLGVFPYGFRYSLILTPLLIPLFVLSLKIRVFGNYQWLVTAIISILVISISIMSLPNQSFQENIYPKNGWDWPETENIEPIVDYWLQNRQNSSETYIYYGALPAFGYYLSLKQDTHQQALPPTWYSNCWQKTIINYCSNNNIYYGQWLRHLEAPQKVLAIQTSMPQKTPQNLWLIFSHIYANEDELILTELQKQYNIVDSYKQTKAAAYLLHKK